jgi:hypothetical protein
VAWRTQRSPACEVGDRWSELEVDEKKVREQSEEASDVESNGQHRIKYLSL